MTTPTLHDHLRAALIAVIVFSHGLVAIPIGPRVTETSIQKPQAVLEVDRWMELAAPLGFTREGFEQTVIDGSAFLISLDRQFVRPMARTWKMIGVGQAWALFAVPLDTPRRLELYGTIPDGRTVLYRRHDAHHHALGPVFGYRRIRGIYDRGKRTRSYSRLFQWTAAALFRDHPTLQHVEMIQRERRVGVPGAIDDPQEHPVLRHAISRGTLADRRPDLGVSP